MTALLLRPKEKITSSTAYFVDKGADTVGVGLIHIVPQPDAMRAFIQQTGNLSSAQQQNCIAVFVSTHAGDIASKCVDYWPKQIAVYAVGPSTAQSLKTLNVSVTVPDIANSEGLLSLPTLQNLTGKTVYLFKGVGGRVLIPAEMAERGADVQEIDVYQRHRCVSPSQTRHFEADEIRCVIATSGEIMQAAWGYYDQQWLKSLTWIVVSRRLVDFAAKLGITKVVQSTGASDEQLFNALTQFLER